MDEERYSVYISQVCSLWVVICFFLPWYKVGFIEVSGFDILIQGLKTLNKIWQVDIRILLLVISSIFCHALNAVFIWRKNPQPSMIFTSLPVAIWMTGLFYVFVKTGSGEAINLLLPKEAGGIGTMLFLAVGWLSSFTNFLTARRNL